MPSQYERPPLKRVKVVRSSGFVYGPCMNCGKEARGLVMFEDYGLGVECLECSATERVEEVEWIGERADVSL